MVRAFMKDTTLATSSSVRSIVSRNPWPDGLDSIASAVKVSIYFIYLDLQDPEDELESLERYQEKGR